MVDLLAEEMVAWLVLFEVAQMVDWMVTQ